MSVFIPGQNYTPIKKELTSVYNLPDVKKLLAIPELKPYVQPELIPDLLFLYNNLKDASLLIAAAKQSDPNDPKSILFVDVLNKLNVDTYEKETTLVQNEPLVMESTTIKCHCSSSKVYIINANRQSRSSDEGSDIVALCASCKTRIVLRG